MLRGTFLIPAYQWLIASLARVAAVSVVLAAVLIATGLSLGPITAGVIGAVVLFAAGGAAYQVRRSGAALHYPGVDRFFQRVPCYLSIQDKDLRIIRTNKLFHRDFGDKIGEYCYNAYKGADTACPDCPVLKTFQDGLTHSAQETVITADGKTANVIVYTTPIHDEQGRVAGVMEMSTNITEVKKLQDEIETSRKEYMDLFDKVPCYLSTLDKDFRILRVNRLFRQEFGGAPGEYCYKIYKGRDSVCPDCHVAKTLEDGKIHSSEKTVTKPDGTEAQLIVYSSPIFNDQGEMTAVMEMATDITEIKKLQERIKEGQSRYHHLFEGVPCYISIQDKDLKIIDHNDRFQAEFGKKTGEYCYHVYKQRGEVCPDCPVMKTFEDGQVHSREETVVHRDGTTAHMLVHSSPISDEAGNRVAVMEMSTDITQIKKLQRELTFMGRTVAVMAHRIKNILMGLEGGIFVVNTGFEDADEATVRKGWGMIERNVDSVSRIVKDMLYCAKEREMDFKMIDPIPVIRSVYDLYHDRARRDHITMRLEAPESLNPGRFDDEALHSMLSNLVTNAIDACVNDSREDAAIEHEIIIRAKIDERGRYLFEVVDNGPGMPGHVGESVFEDFYSTKGREGTGLGLLVANKVAEEHGGTITFVSTAGKGTTFTALIPMQSQ